MAIAHLLAQFTRWKTIVQCLGRFWLRLIFIRPLADIERCANHSPFPHGASVLDRDPQRQAYIEAIKEINIPQLASSYNLGKEWVAVGYRDLGSFNFCVFVVFPHDGTKWVVWFPICPLLQEPWRKLQSEVAALKYLRAKMTIVYQRSRATSLMRSVPLLSHGDLQSSNIIVNDDLSLAGIIDWEWSGTVPVQFFGPPLWLGGLDATSPRDAKYQNAYSKLYGSLVDASKCQDPSQTLAREWGPDLSSSSRLFLPAALLRTDLFIDIYYMALFPELYGDAKRDDKLKELDESCGKFREMVRKMMKVSDTD